MRRAKKIEFSNTRLLKQQVHEESTARRRPVEILILLSRVFGIALLVLAFAQPFSEEDDSSNEISNEVVIYLDNSVSMSKNGEDGSLYDRAYALVDGLIQSYPEGTTFRLLENSFESSVSTKHTATSILNYLTVLKQVGIDRTGEEIVSRKSTEDISGDFYWLSDFDAINGMSGVISDEVHKLNLFLLFLNIRQIFLSIRYISKTRFIQGSSQII